MGKFTYIGLAELERRAMLALRMALDDVGDKFERDVKDDMPHLTDAMEGSTIITPVTGSGHHLKRKLTVGARYSIFQHEKDWYQHDDGRAHFVKYPLIKTIPRLRMALRAASARFF